MANQIGTTYQEFCELRGYDANDRSKWSQQMDEWCDATDKRIAEVCEWDDNQKRLERTLEEF